MKSEDFFYIIKKNYKIKKKKQLSEIFEIPYRTCNKWGTSSEPPEYLLKTIIATLEYRKNYKQKEGEEETTKADEKIKTLIKQFEK